MTSMVDPICGGAARMQAPFIAQFWAERARTNPMVERMLRGAVGPVGWLGAIPAHLPLIVVVMAHHFGPADGGHGEGGEEQQPGPHPGGPFATVGPTVGPDANGTDPSRVPPAPDAHVTPQRVGL